MRDLFVMWPDRRMVVLTVVVTAERVQLLERRLAGDLDGSRWPEFVIVVWADGGEQPPVRRKIAEDVRAFQRWQCVAPGNVAADD